jgi:hypothetical protein
VRFTLGGSARLGGVATMANAQVRITLTANPAYFTKRKFADARADWERALFAAEWWAARLVPAHVRVEWQRVVGLVRPSKLSRSTETPPKKASTFVTR